MNDDLIAFVERDRVNSPRPGIETTNRDPAQKHIWILQMASRTQLRPKRLDDDRIDIRRVEQPSPEFNWFLHQAVGTKYRWGGRQDWTAADWSAFVARPGLETWVMYVEGAPAGYFEMEKQNDDCVQIRCFGLLERFTGRGLGSHLLTFAVERAWELKPLSVWLTTCSYDHPHALLNYQARGFEIVDEQDGPANPERSHVIFTSG